MNAVGRSDLFDLSLSPSATNFKETYESLHPDALIWVSKLQSFEACGETLTCVVLFKLRI